MTIVLKKTYDMLIVGAGPAGLTAAIYGVRAGMSVAFIEKDAPGGKMVRTHTIENYPGIKEINGADLSLQMFDHATSTGAEYLYGEIVKITLEGKVKVAHTASGDKFYGMTIVVATGMVERELGVPGEKEYYGKGVSYCAVCDGALYRGQEVAVIGGGNSAVEEATYLTGVVKKVHLIHRRSEFRADPHAVKVMNKQSNIVLHLNAQAKEFLGDGNNITGVLVTKDGKEYTLPVGAIFPYVGLDPVSGFAKSLGIVNEDGTITVDQNMETSVKGVYSIGDVNQKILRQVATAVNDGAIAAVSAKQYVLANK